MFVCGQSQDLIHGVGARFGSNNSDAWAEV